MINIRKNILGLVVATLPMVALAADATPAKEVKPAVEAKATAKTEKVASNKSETKKPTMLSLQGVNKENREGIEKLAKENGAKHASLNAKSGMLKLTGGSFNKEQFVGQLGTKFPGVSVKE